MNKKKRIAILGQQDLLAPKPLRISEQSDIFEVEVLTAHSSSSLLKEQALKYRPNAVVIGDESNHELNGVLFSHGIKVYVGSEALSQVVEMDSIDMVLTALVGYADLPTIQAIKAKKNIALANKETLVVAGGL